MICALFCNVKIGIKMPTSDIRYIRHEMIALLLLSKVEGARPYAA